MDIKFNQNCKLEQCKSENTNRSAINLFQVTSKNSESPDKTNYIYSSIGGPPMIIISSSTKDAALNIDWDVLLNKKSTNTSGLHFNVTQDAAIGLMVEKVILFDDTDNDGLFTKTKPHIEIDWAQVNWDLASKTTFNKEDFLRTYFRMRSQHKYLNGNILVKISIPRDLKADRQKEVPHLKLNSQSISMVVIVDGIQPPAEYKNARLTITFLVVVQTPEGHVSLDTDSESLISDEYTPGVFRIKSLQFRSKPNPAPKPVPVEETTSPANVIVAYDDGRANTTQNTSQSAMQPLADAQVPRTDKHGFLLWKEVAYTDKRKIISRTIDVFDNELEMNVTTLSKISPPFYEYFRHKPAAGPRPDYKLFRFNLSFGKSGTSYSSTNFTDFSFVFGLGAAPREHMFSFLIKIIIFVCFCLPIIVMFAGLGYLLLRRFRRYGDTELLLAAES